MTLSAAEFSAFFKAVHGYDPFPWQERLAAQVLDSGTQGGWPDMLAVPTGCGKTSALDVALFALAAQPQRFPRRVVLVVDRRVVVDQAYIHAKRINLALTRTTDAVAQQVADKLRSLWGGRPSQSPIECALLRGGMPRDDDWARRPDRPVLALSTVDQVGSRLLFRGYGVSPKSTSIHAGLLGQDTLFLLDEVHLAVPFAETLLALRGRWRRFWPNSLPDRWGVVRLSATPGLTGPKERVFAVEPGGKDDDHPHLLHRLQARKPTVLREVSLKGKDEDAKRGLLAAAAARAAVELLGSTDARSGQVRTLGVIVNRVATAREIASLLQASAGGAFDVQLLTGRMRALDRDAVLRLLLPRIEAGRDRAAESRPLVVVATQCIEAGADFDFDALISECASLDALRQRFGRLDRLGDRHRAGLCSPSIVLGRSDQLGLGADPDPLYGEALRATWNWLQRLADGLDLGIRQLPELEAEMLSSLTAPKSHAPVLLPAQIDAWSQTHPRPRPDPEVALWLHGPKRSEPEVQIVWRADLSAELLELALADTAAGQRAREELLARLDACPPGSGESLSLPISAARRWLTALAPVELADAAMQAPGESRETPKENRLCYAWAGDESFVVDAVGIRPGMTLVVPAAYGGITNGNWSPHSRVAVEDHGDQVQWIQRRRATLRLNEFTLPAQWRVLPVPAEVAEESVPDLRRRIDEWIGSLPLEATEPWCDIVAALRCNPRIVTLPDGGLTLLGRKAAPDSVSSEDDGASFIEREVTLEAHSSHVWRWADGFARRLELPELLRQDLTLAAWLHDAGKADPRFQKWLAGGSAVRLALMDRPLAKSVQSVRDHLARRQARLRAGYPDGYRHELLSVAMVSGSETLLAQANDRDLVLHLIGAHHGWCRPFAPFVDDEEDMVAAVSMVDGPNGCTAQLGAGTRHRLARLDSGVTDRFWTLNERYGWWGLAWLEALLRLADHRASEQGEPGGGDE